MCSLIDWLVLLTTYNQDVQGLNTTDEQAGVAQNASTACALEHQWRWSDVTNIHRALGMRNNAWFQSNALEFDLHLGEICSETVEYERGRGDTV